jgi:tetratricopeptide (TPR) repeat protein
MKAFYVLIRYLILVAICGVLFGCSIIKPINSGDGRLSKDLHRHREMSMYSDALHGFIVGSLYSQSGDFNQAQQYLSKMHSLLGDTASPGVLVRLGEVLLISGGKKEEVLQFVQRAYELKREDPDLAVFYGNLLLADGAYNQALEVFSKIRPSEVRAFEATMLSCAIYTRYDKLSTCIGDLKKLTQNQRSNSRAYYYLALFEELAGDYSAALKSIGIATKLNTEDAMVDIVAARIALKSNDITKGLLYYKRALKLQPANPQLALIISILEEGGKNSSKLQSAIRANSNFDCSLSSVRFNLAESLFNDGQYEQALRQLYVLLWEQPNFHQARYQLALVYAGSGEHRHAVSELMRIPEKDDFFVKARVFASVLDKQLKRHKAAEEHIRKALSKERDNLQILIYLVGILREAGRYQEAEKVILKALESSPESVTLIYDYAMLLHVMQRWDEARKLMERLVRIDDTHHAALNYLAYIRTLQPTTDNKLAEALTLVKRALKFDPDNGYYLDTMGWILYQQGSYDEARKVLSQASILVHNDGQVQEHFADSLLKSNLRNKAYDVYRNALGAYENQRDAGVLLDVEAIRRVKEKLRSI